MKKLLLFASCIFIFLSKSSAQQYYPLLDSINEWYYTGNQFPVSPPHSQLLPVNPCSYPNYGNFGTSTEITGADTIINSLTYKQVTLNYQFSSPCVYGYIREDTASKKVYFQDAIGSAEILLYDFSMQVGDAISVNFFVNGYFTSGSYVLDSISNITIRAGARRIFYLNCHACISHTLAWIESVGNPGDAIYPYCANEDGGTLSCPGFPHDFSQIMTCFDHSQKVYYDSCAYQAAIQNWCFNILDTCDYWNICGSVNEISSLSNLVISPNPSNGNMILNIKVEHPVTVELLVWDITGKQLLKKISLGHVEQGVRNKELNLSSLCNGFYLLECRTKEGSVFKKIILEK